MKCGAAVTSLLVLVIASACSGSDAALPADTEAITMSSPSVDETLAAVETLPPTVPPTTVPGVQLPAIVADPEVVVEQLANPQVSVWLADATGTAASPGISEPCSIDPPLIDAATATAIVTLADEVLAELAVNLDGALGGIAAACELGDLASATEEAVDAAAIAAAIDVRLEELGA